MRRRSTALAIWGLWLLASGGQMAVLVGQISSWLRSGGSQPGPENSVFELVVILAGGVGALILSRLPRHLVGWCFYAGAILSMLQTIGGAYAEQALAAGPGGLPGGVWAAWLANWVGGPGWALLVIYVFLLFPTGRLPSARWWPVAGLSLALLGWGMVSNILRPTLPVGSLAAVANPLGQAWVVPLLRLQESGLFQLVLASTVVAAIASVVVRFRSAAGEQRQQLKWVAFSASVFLVIALYELTLAHYLPAALMPLRVAVINLALATFPVSVGLAILRYHLWDIDLLIRRTLIYSMLTGVLALVYVGSVLALQVIFGGITGEAQTPLVTVFSTLAIAGLFGPLRSRVQAFIDRRFYRRKYDAARTLEQFAAAARDETDLERLKVRLASVVQETMQPEHVTLWVRSADKPLR